MGNLQSSSKTLSESRRGKIDTLPAEAAMATARSKNFYEVLDYISSYYILTSDFESLAKLSDKSYCDDLIVLTSEIIDKQFSALEVTYLAKRIKDGHSHDDSAASDKLRPDELINDDIIFLNTSHLEKLKIENRENKLRAKKHICIGIAKF